MYATSGIALDIQLNDIYNYIIIIYYIYSTNHKTQRTDWCECFAGLTAADQLLIIFGSDSFLAEKTFIITYIDNKKWPINKLLFPNKDESSIGAV